MLPVRYDRRHARTYFTFLLPIWTRSSGHKILHCHFAHIQALLSGACAVGPPCCTSTVVCAHGRPSMPSSCKEQTFCARCTHSFWTLRLCLSQTATMFMRSTITYFRSWASWVCVLCRYRRKQRPAWDVSPLGADRMRQTMSPSRHQTLLS